MGLCASAAAADKANGAQGAAAGGGAAGAAAAPGGGGGGGGGGGQQNEYEDEYDSYEDEPPPLSEQEIRERIQEGAGSQYLPDFNYTLKYAWQSQRGYYPESLDKNNQDACKIVKNFNGEANIGYFGVYDGHGSYGDKVSGFVRDRIPRLLIKAIGKTPAADASFDDKFSRAHERCNELCHQAPNFDDASSGTTAVSVWIEGTTVKVANLGDSRAVVAARNPKSGRLKAIALSQDQTPYRKDERERCKLEGARIMTMDQLEGLAPMHEDWGVNLGEEIDDGGDPPRIWAADGRYPGTAFTRSIGDHIADAVDKQGLLS